MAVAYTTFVGDFRRVAVLEDGVFAEYRHNLIDGLLGTRTPQTLVQLIKKRKRHATRGYGPHSVPCEYLSCLLPREADHRDVRTALLSLINAERDRRKLALLEIRPVEEHQILKIVMADHQVSRSPHSVSARHFDHRTQTVLACAPTGADP